MPTEFEENVYSLTKKIPKGKITTYKLLARKLKTRACRAVGNALNKNPYSPQVPCHRVVNSGGKVGGFAGGAGEKIRLLRKEGIKVKDDRIVDFEEVLCKFDCYAV